MNNTPDELKNLQLTQTVYRLNGSQSGGSKITSLASVPASTTITPYTLWVDPHISEVYFVKLDLRDAAGKLLSTNLYWKNVAEDDFKLLETMPVATLHMSASPHIVGRTRCWT